LAWCGCVLFFCLQGRMDDEMAVRCECTHARASPSQNTTLSLSHTHLVLDGRFVQVVAANGARVRADGPRPHGHRVPLFDLKTWARACPARSRGLGLALGVRGGRRSRAGFHLHGVAHGVLCVCWCVGVGLCVRGKRRRAADAEGRLCVCVCERECLFFLLSDREDHRHAAVGPSAAGTTCTCHAAPACGFQNSPHPVRGFVDGHRGPWTAWSRRRHEATPADTCPQSRTPVKV
jgi:hypothetical protein